MCEHSKKNAFFEGYAPVKEEHICMVMGSFDAIQLSKILFFVILFNVDFANMNL